MGYIPKGLVNEGLYTNGGEFTTTNGKPYKGYYHQLFDGAVSSGKTPNSPDSQPLITNYSTDQQNYYLVLVHQILLLI